MHSSRTMTLLTLGAAERVSRTLALLACFALAGCSAYKTARIVTLDEVPLSESYRRPEGAAPEPLFVETTAALVAKRQLKTAISVVPSLESHLERELEAALGVEVEQLRVSFVGYRYAYYFPSRDDDFVLTVEVTAPAANLHGELEGRIRGNEPLAPLIGLDLGWHDLIPDTGLGRDESENTRKLERRADQQAWIQRALLLEATRRLVASAGAQRGA